MVFGFGVVFRSDSWLPSKFRAEVGREPRLAKLGDVE